MTRRTSARCLLLALGVATLAGCADRRIRVTSEPPGAMVWVNDVQIGRTPAETRFVHYGTFDVRLELDGHEPVSEARKANAPLHEYPGPDLIAEAIPARIEHVVEWHFDLLPAREVAEEPGAFEDGLLERANELANELGRSAD